jgi:hypothetical protein
MKKQPLLLTNIFFWSVINNDMIYWMQTYRQQVKLSTAEHNLSLFHTQTSDLISDNLE